MILNTPDKPFPATLDTDGTLAANSDSVVASQKATKTYADTKGVIDGQQINDGSSLLSADFGARQLVTADGHNAIDWSNNDYVKLRAPFVVGIPTSDPAVVGQLWNNSGVVTVSAG